MSGNNNYRRTDIRSTVKVYMRKRKPNHRYTSFDYCFNHFSNSRRTGVDIEKSCLALGFYLASWGMYRGKSFMLQTSVKQLLPAVEFIHSLDKSYWKIDVDKYTPDNIDRLITLYETLKSKLNCEDSAHLTLVTKIMLGVFGNVPAYDRYFCETFRQVFKGDCAFRTFSEQSLFCLKQFYDANQKMLSSLPQRFYTFDFISGEETKRRYTLAKVIDMYGFNNIK
jgi:hypothetical protein